MREESAFSPRIESFANAIGLTQMLVKTARRFSDGAPVTRDDAAGSRPRTSSWAARFLGFLWKRFDGAAPLAIAGYNAGEAAVDRWLGERGDLDMDEFMETIPYDETRNYTKRVLASYFAYSWLYGDKPVPAVPLRARAEASQGRARQTRRPRRSRTHEGLTARLLLLLAPEQPAPLGVHALAAGRRVGAQVLLLLGAERRRARPA